jgi:hypothetical protein
MAVALNFLNSAEANSGNGYSTASLTWTAGARGVVCVATFNSGGTVTGHSISGGGVTWTEIAFIVYGSARGLSILVSDGTPSNGTLTITAAFSGGSFGDSIWNASEITGFDSAQWPSTATENSASDPDPSPLIAPDVGTIAAGDLAVFCFAYGQADATGNGVTVGGSSTEVDRVENVGGSVRSLMLATTTADDTPQYSYTTQTSCAIVAALFKAAAAAASPVIGRRIFVLP